MGYNFAAASRRVHRLIKKYGREMILLRDESVAYRVTAAVVEFSPSEKGGSLWQATDRMIVVSTIGLPVDPDHESDQLVNPPYVLRIVAPPGKLAPANQVLFWELHCREVRQNTNLYSSSVINSNQVNSVEVSDG